MLRSLISTLAVAAALAPAHADETKSFSGAKALEISDFIGSVEIAASGDKIMVALTDGEKDFPVIIDQSGDLVTVRGEKPLSKNKISRQIGWRSGNDGLRSYVAKYPKLKILVPKGAAVDIDDSFTVVRGGDIDGDLAIDSGYVIADFGDVKSADISIHSAGDVTLGAVRKALDLEIHGSGNFAAVSAGETDVEVHGSGDVRLGDIAGSTSIEIHGSGDFQATAIKGDFDASIHGSGDIETGKIARGADLSIHGSGDIELAEVNGPTQIQIAGGGDIEVAKGRAEDLDVRINGSGDFDFGGVSTNLSAVISGSGQVSVAKNEGTFDASGDGTVRVGGVVKYRKKHY